MIASSTRSGTVFETIGAAAHKVFSEEVKDAKGMKKETIDLVPTDEVFRSAFETATVSKATLARYYMRSLEMAAKNEKTPWFIPNDDKQTINLEHILPERPALAWPQFDEEILKTYSKRLGNMALLLAKNNSDLRSSDFTIKKAVYTSSPYELTRQLSSVPDWTKEHIINRQKVLAELALKAWPL